MITDTPGSASVHRIRGGTALRQRGKARVREILQAARDILLDEGYAALTLRNVAGRAGISLGNLSYYFGSKDDLFKSLIDQVLQEYTSRWEEIRSRIPDDPGARLLAIIDYLVEDCRQPEAQQFFYQLWAISTHDAFVSRCRDETYQLFHKQMFELCRDVRPELHPDVLSRRVCVLMALIEGLHVIFGNASGVPADPASLDREVREQALRIIHAP